MSSATKEKSPVAGELGGDFGRDKQQANCITEKVLSTIRARLCLSGGQRLYVAEDNVYFVSNPFGQLSKFDTLAELQTHADRGAR